MFRPKTQRGCANNGFTIKDTRYLHQCPQWKNSGTQTHERDHKSQGNTKVTRAQKNLVSKRIQSNGKRFKVNRQAQSQRKVQASQKTNRESGSATRERAPAVKGHLTSVPRTWKQESTANQNNTKKCSIDERSMEQSRWQNEKNV